MSQEGSFLFHPTAGNDYGYSAQQDHYRKRRKAPAFGHGGIVRPVPAKMEGETLKSPTVENLLWKLVLLVLARQIGFSN